MSKAIDIFKLETRSHDTNDPSVPSTAPLNKTRENDFNPPKKKFKDYFYNREKKEYCGRTCTSWLCIIGYGIIYLMFLCTYTLIILYVSLYVLKELIDFKAFEPTALVYPLTGIGLTATPTSETNAPLIWYKKGEKDDYIKYVQAIDRLMSARKNRDKLGPCGQYPYGYGDDPCVIIKINKRFEWSGKPLQLNSTDATVLPNDVKKWMKTHNNKLWLQCDGYQPHDQEHIGTIRYYPDPPGFDLDIFPMREDDSSPLAAVQISGFTIGISLAIECKLWYENGPSSVDFVLYVAPNDSIAFTGQTSFND